MKKKITKLKKKKKYLMKLKKKKIKDRKNYINY